MKLVWKIVITNSHIGQTNTVQTCYLSTAMRRTTNSLGVGQKWNFLNQSRLALPITKRLTLSRITDWIREKLQIYKANLARLKHGREHKNHNQKRSEKLVSLSRQQLEQNTNIKSNGSRRSKLHSLLWGNRDNKTYTVWLANIGSQEVFIILAIELN